MLNLYNKYKDVIPYLFFGVCTTVVNVVIYWFLSHIICLSVGFSTIIAWIISVLFAYLTNRIWVFHSDSSGVKEITKEMVSFFGCRLATGILDWLIMFVLVDCFEYNDVLIKIISNIMVIVLNYIASKVFIFRSEKK